MKQLLIAFLNFSRVERLGIAVMGVLLMLLILFRLTLSLWVKPRGIDKARQEKLEAAYLHWKRTEDLAKTDYAAETRDQPARAGELFAFDPNTLDSIGFIKLGLPARAVKGLLNWRRKGKHFYKHEDLKPLYNLPPETYARIAPWVRMPEGAATGSKPAGYGAYPAIPARIELNTADSALLDRGIRGVGATLAHKIIARREALGGFFRHEQLLEVYRFPDSSFEQMKEKLNIDARLVQKMNLNTVSLARMSAHPYIGERTAKYILLYKEGIVRYDHIEQLREVPLMSEEIYRKIAPYFVVE